MVRVTIQTTTIPRAPKAFTTSKGMLQLDGVRVECEAVIRKHRDAVASGAAPDMAALQADLQRSMTLIKRKYEKAVHHKADHLRHLIKAMREQLRTHTQGSKRHTRALETIPRLEAKLTEHLQRKKEAARGAKAHMDWVARNGGKKTAELHD